MVGRQLAAHRRREPAAGGLITMDLSAGAVAFGPRLRHWRQQRGLSQLALALQAEVSTRHLSWLETGKAQPSRAMVLRLARQLHVPLAERNVLLVAAGHAPAWPRRTLDDPALAPALQTVRRLLAAHEPYPALAVDRHWNLLAHNRVVVALLQTVDPSLLVPPVNVVRLCLHPRGLAPMIVNRRQWLAHLLVRLQPPPGLAADDLIQALLDEVRTALSALPPSADVVPDDADVDGLVQPFQLRTPFGQLNLIGTITVFGTPQDVLLSELAIETFFPADEATAHLLQGLMQAAAGAPVQR
jgi:transcriptional regulator with XRE-family HTH domain